MPYKGQQHSKNARVAYQIVLLCLLTTVKVYFMWHLCSSIQSIYTKWNRHIQNKANCSVIYIEKFLQECSVKLCKRETYRHEDYACIEVREQTLKCDFNIARYCSQQKDFILFLVSTSISETVQEYGHQKLTFVVVVPVFMFGSSS